MHNLHPKLWSLLHTCTPMLVLQLSLIKIWIMWLSHVYCLSGTNLKYQRPPLPNQLKKNFFFFFFFRFLMCVSVSTPIPQIKILATLNPQIKIIFDTTTTPLRLFLEASVSGLHILDKLLKKKNIYIYIYIDLDFHARCSLVIFFYSYLYSW